MLGALHGSENLELDRIGVGSGATHDFGIECRKAFKVNATVGGEVVEDFKHPAALVVVESHLVVGLVGNHAGEQACGCKIVVGAHQVGVHISSARYDVHHLAGHIVGERLV